MIAAGARRRAARAALGLSAALYVWALLWSFDAIMVVAFEYEGIHARPLGILSGVATVGLAMLPVLWLPTEWRRPSDAALLLLYVQVFVPVVLFSPHLTRLDPETSVLYSILLLASLLLTQAVLRAPMPELPAVRIPHGILLGGMVLLTLGLALYVGVLTGFQLDLSIGDVYLRRYEARETLPAGSLGRYGLAVLSAALIPLGISLGCAGRTRLGLVASGVGIVAVFSFTGQKSVALTPLLLGAFWALWRFCRPQMAVAMVLTAALLTAGSAASYLSGNGLPVALFTWRLLVAAARNHAYHLEYFASHPMYYFGGGLLRGIVDSPYHAPMSLMIGAEYSTVPGINLNANAWASAFGDLGAWGMLLVGAPIGAVLWLLDAAHVRLRDATAPLLAGFLAFIFAEQSFSTSILSGGVAATTGVLLLLAVTHRPRAAGR